MEWGTKAEVMRRHGIHSAELARIEKRGIEGALAALKENRRKKPDPEKEALANEVARVKEALTEQSVEVTLLRKNEIGITQDHSRPHTPNDNAHAEAVIATAKRERLYAGEFENIYEVQDALDDLVDHYNNVRLRQGIGYVTSQVKHMGLEEMVFEARRSSLARAREERLQYNKRIENPESDQDWSVDQEAETVTLMEPVLSGRL